MKFKDCFNMYENKTNKQVKFELKKRMLKGTDMKIKDIMNIEIPISKKLKDFENI